MKISDIRKYDSKRMYEPYENWPEIAEENYFYKDLQKVQFKNIDHIVYEYQSDIQHEPTFQI